MARLNDLIRSQSAAGGSPQVSFRPAEPAPETSSGKHAASEVQEADDWYASAEAELEAIGRSVQVGQAFSLTGISQLADDLVSLLSHSDRLLVKAIAGHRGDLIITNLVNTAILSVRLAYGLDYASDALGRLALAALLHDVGMWSLPEALLHKAGPLTPEEHALLKEHPQHGAQILRRLGPDRAWLAEIALQEHERVDGQGYPRGLKGRDIQEDAQVIGLADSLDALIGFHPYRKRFLPHEAVRELMTKQKTSFSTRVLKCLIRQFSVFPLGTCVRLNSGESGEVVKLNAHFPLRPVIKVYLDPDSQRIAEPRTVDLSTTSLLHITEVVPEDVPHDDR